MRLETDRLLLRLPRDADAAALAERRSQPAVAEYQSWPTPYVLADAEALIAEAGAVPEPYDGRWWMLTIADDGDSKVFGDLAIRLSNDARTAEVGYTLAQEYWGAGIATEALISLIDWLFGDRGVTRIGAHVHPDNLRSAQVLERCGFEFEGHTKNSFWDGDENSDDWIYGLTPELWTEWCRRPRNAPETLELVEPYPTGLRNVVALRTHKSQERFVAPIASSLAQVAVPPIENGGQVVPWPRIIHADGEPVGFVMLTRQSATEPIPYLWRLLIDRRHQRRGIGRRVVELVKDEVRSWGSDALMVSWVPGVGSPAPLYLAAGFVETGEIIDDEVVARVEL